MTFQQHAQPGEEPERNELMSKRYDLDRQIELRQRCKAQAARLQPSRTSQSIAPTRSITPQQPKATAQAVVAVPAVAVVPVVPQLAVDELPGIHAALSLRASLTAGKSPTNAWQQPQQPAGSVGAAPVGLSLRSPVRDLIRTEAHATRLRQFSNPELSEDPLGKAADTLSGQHERRMDRREQ